MSTDESAEERGTRMCIARLHSEAAVAKAHGQHPDSLVDYTHPDVVALSRMSIFDLIRGGRPTGGAVFLVEIADQEGWS